MRDLKRLQDMIDEREQPVTIFFRDDDAGWANERLVALCQRFAACDAELDLAVIPGAMDDRAQETLCELLQEHGPLLHLHQHGHSHENHQETGRKCEFGNSRRLDVQRRDIAAGQQRLKALFGELIEPVFTPPWNRCTSECCRALAELDFAAISRICGSDALEHFGLADVSVAIDWQKKRGGVRLSEPDFFRYAANQFDQHSVVGIMLHHETMDDTELDCLTRFLRHLQKSPKAELSTMLEIAVVANSTKPEAIFREYACH